MDHSECSPLPFDLEMHVQVRTHWRVRNLAIEVYPERAVLRGQATTAFTRHLAEQVVQEFLPHVRLENSIAVDHPVEVMAGMPLN